MTVKQLLIAPGEPKRAHLKKGVESLCAGMVLSGSQRPATVV